MRRSRFSEEQKVEMVRETEQSSAAEVATKRQCAPENTERCESRLYLCPDLPSSRSLREKLSGSRNFAGGKTNN